MASTLRIDQRMLLESVSTTFDSLENNPHVLNKKTWRIPSNNVHTSPRRAVFANHSSLKHSCLPTAFADFKKEEEVMELRAVTEIKKYQEITIDYLMTNEWPDRGTRRQALFDNFGFWCHCPLCSKSAAPGAMDQGSKTRTRETAPHRDRERLLQQESPRVLLGVQSAALQAR